MRNGDDFHRASCQKIGYNQPMEMLTSQDPRNNQLNAMGHVKVSLENLTGEDSMVTMMDHLNNYKTETKGLMYHETKIEEYFFDTMLDTGSTMNIVSGKTIDKLIAFKGGDHVNSLIREAHRTVQPPMIAITMNGEFPMDKAIQLTFSGKNGSEVKAVCWIAEKATIDVLMGVELMTKLGFALTTPNGRKNAKRRKRKEHPLFSERTE
jgi:hypothetical protein